MGPRQAVVSAILGTADALVIDVANALVDDARGNNIPILTPCFGGCSSVVTGATPGAITNLNELTSVTLRSTVPSSRFGDRIVWLDNANAAIATCPAKNTDATVGGNTSSCTVSMTANQTINTRLIPRTILTIEGTSTVDATLAGVATLTDITSSTAEADRLLRADASVPEAIGFAVDTPVAGVTYTWINSTPNAASTTITPRGAGDGCTSGSTNCIFNQSAVDPIRNVTLRATSTLTTAKNGTGNIRANLGSDAGTSIFTCNSDAATPCTQVRIPAANQPLVGSTVVLTATALNTGDVITWGGADVPATCTSFTATNANKSNACTVSMTTARTVNVSFTSPLVITVAEGRTDAGNEDRVTLAVAPVTSAPGDNPITYGAFVNTALPGDCQRGSVVANCSSQVVIGNKVRLTSTSSTANVRRVWAIRNDTGVILCEEGNQTSATCTFVMPRLNVGATNIVATINHNIRLIFNYLGSSANATTVITPNTANAGTTQNCNRTGVGNCDTDTLDIGNGRTSRITLTPSRLGDRVEWTGDVPALNCTNVTTNPGRITSITTTNAGRPYTLPPLVRIANLHGASGSGARVFVLPAMLTDIGGGVLELSNNTVLRINNPGTGYENAANVDVIFTAPPVAALNRLVPQATNIVTSAVVNEATCTLLMNQERTINVTARPELFLTIEGTGVSIDVNSRTVGGVYADTSISTCTGNSVHTDCRTFISAGHEVQMTATNIPAGASVRWSSNPTCTEGNQTSSTCTFITTPNLISKTLTVESNLTVAASGAVTIRDRNADDPDAVICTSTPGGTCTAANKISLQTGNTRRLRATVAGAAIGNVITWLDTTTAAAPVAVAGCTDVRTTADTLFSECTVTVGENRTITAFSRVPIDLTVNGRNADTVEIDVGSGAAGAFADTNVTACRQGSTANACQTPVLVGDRVRLSRLATANIKGTWSIRNDATVINCTEGDQTSQTCTFTVSNLAIQGGSIAVSITHEFELSIAKNGSVDVAGANIAPATGITAFSCNGATACTNRDIRSNLTVRLTATALNAGEVITWGGGKPAANCADFTTTAADLNTTCDVPMDQARAITVSISSFVNVTVARTGVTVAGETRPHPGGVAGAWANNAILACTSTTDDDPATNDGVCKVIANANTTAANSDEIRLTATGKPANTSWAWSGVVCNVTVADPDGDQTTSTCSFRKTFATQNVRLNVTVVLDVNKIGTGGISANVTNAAGTQLFNSTSADADPANQNVNIAGVILLTATGVNGQTISWLIKDSAGTAIATDNCSNTALTALQLTATCSVTTSTARTVDVFYGVPLRVTVTEGSTSVDVDKITILSKPTAATVAYTATSVTNCKKGSAVDDCTAIIVPGHLVRVQTSTTNTSAPTKVWTAITGGNGVAALNCDAAGTVNCDFIMPSLGGVNTRIALSVTHRYSIKPQRSGGGGSFSMRLSTAAAADPAIANSTCNGNAVAPAVPCTTLANAIEIESGASVRITSIVPLANVGDIIEWDGAVGTACNTVGNTIADFTTTNDDLDSECTLVMDRDRTAGNDRPLLRFVPKFELTVNGNASEDIQVDTSATQNGVYAATSITVCDSAGGNACSTNIVTGRFVKLTAVTATTNPVWSGPTCLEGDQTSHTCTFEMTNTTRTATARIVGSITVRKSGLGAIAATDNTVDRNAIANLECLNNNTCASGTSKTDTSISNGGVVRLTATAATAGVRIQFRTINTAVTPNTLAKIATCADFTTIVGSLSSTCLVTVGTDTNIMVLFGVPIQLNVAGLSGYTVTATTISGIIAGATAIANDIDCTTDTSNVDDCETFASQGDTLAFTTAGALNASTRTWRVTNSNSTTISCTEGNQTGTVCTFAVPSNATDANGTTPIKIDLTYTYTLSVNFNAATGNANAVANINGIGTLRENVADADRRIDCTSIATSTTCDANQGLTKTLNGGSSITLIATANNIGDQIRWRDGANTIAACPDKATTTGNASSTCTISISEAKTINVTIRPRMSLEIVGTNGAITAQLGTTDPATGNTTFANITLAACNPLPVDDANCAIVAGDAQIRLTTTPTAGTTPSYKWETVDRAGTATALVGTSGCAAANNTCTFNMSSTFNRIRVTTYGTLTFNVVSTHTDNTVSTTTAIPTLTNAAGVTINSGAMVPVTTVTSAITRTAVTFTATVHADNVGDQILWRNGANSITDCDDFTTSAGNLSSTCSIAINQASTITVTFKPELTIIPLGIGSVAVGTKVAGVAAPGAYVNSSITTCSSTVAASDCNEIIELPNAGVANTSVRITASATNGVAGIKIIFTHADATNSAVTGCATTTTTALLNTATCTVDMTSSINNIRVAFVADITVTKTGNGTVTTPANGLSRNDTTTTRINCGATCSLTNVTTRTSAVTFTATADTAGDLIVWGGASVPDTCTQTLTAAGSLTSTCAITINSDKTDIDVSFVSARTLTMAVNKSTGVTGTVKAVTQNETIEVFSCSSGINNANCTPSIANNSIIVITATATVANIGIIWSGADKPNVNCNDTITAVGALTSTCQVTMNAAKTINVAFRSRFALTVNRTQNTSALMGTGGQAVSNPTGISCTTNGIGQCGNVTSFNNGTSVELTATPDGTDSVNWGTVAGKTTGCELGDLTCTFPINADRTVTIDFVTTHLLTVSRTGRNVTVAADLNGSSNNGINCGTSGTGACGATSRYLNTQSVELTATVANANDVITWSWTDAAAIGCAQTFTTAVSLTSTCTVSMSQARTVTVTVGQPFQLTVTRASNNLTVTTDINGSSNNGINCATSATGACGANTNYQDGTSITLTATSPDPNRIISWSGIGAVVCPDVTTTALILSSSCIITMSAARNVTVTSSNIRVLTHAKLNTNGADNTRGTISAISNGNNIYTCNTACTATQTSNRKDAEVITLRATAANAGDVIDWSGADATGCTDKVTTAGDLTSDCSITMSQNRTVNVSFKQRFALTVSKTTGANDTTGGLTSTSTSTSFTAVNCNSACNTAIANQNIDNSSTVTFTATADNANQRIIWSVTPAGAINAGATNCTDFDSAVNKTSNCIITVTAATTVNVQYINLHTLTVTRNGTTNLTVTADNPTGGFSCASGTGNCAATGTFINGRSVTLTATIAAADAGSVISWGTVANKTAGCDDTITAAGSLTSTCTFPMTAARTVTLDTKMRFTLTHSKLNTNGADNTRGSISATSNGNSIYTCNTACTATQTSNRIDGDVITLRATAANVGDVIDWSGADAAGCTDKVTAAGDLSSDCTVTMTGARTVDVSFKPRFSLGVTKTIGANDRNGSLTSTSASTSFTAVSCNDTCTTAIANQNIDNSSTVSFTATATSANQRIIWTVTPAGAINAGATNCTSFDTTAGNIASTCSITVTVATTVDVRYIDIFTLTATRNGTTNLTVTADAPNGGFSCASGIGNCAATGTFVKNRSVTLTATVAAADAGRVISWGTVSNKTSGCDDIITAAGSLTSTCTFPMTAARTVTLDTKGKFALTVTRAGNNSTVSSAPVGISCSTNGTGACGNSADYVENTSVTLTATAATNSDVISWAGHGGACADSIGSGTCTVTMSAARTVTVTASSAFDLSVTRSGEAVSVVSSVNGSNANGLGCGTSATGACPNITKIKDGTSVTLTTTTSSANQRVAWSGTGAEGCSSTLVTNSGGTATCNVTMSAARTVTVTVSNTTDLDITKSGTGSITSSGAGTSLACPVADATCTTQKANNSTAVTLTATTNSTNVRVSWAITGGASTCNSSDVAASGGTATCSVTSATAVTVSFIQLRTVTVSKTGSTGNLTITASVGGNTILTCAAGTNTCNRSVPTGSSVLLRGTTTDIGNRLTWSGDATGTVITSAGANNDRLDSTINVNANVSVSLASLQRHAVTVTKTGDNTAAATVTATVGGNNTAINCGATCTDNIDTASNIVLTATPGTTGGINDSIVWSGVVCTEAAPTTTCTVNNVTNAINPSVAFTSNFRITATRTVGGNNGALASNPVRINCAAADNSCNATFNRGSTVVLTGTPATAGDLVEWTGCTTNTTTTCTITNLQATTTIDFRFVTKVNLTVNLAGNRFPGANISVTTPQVSNYSGLCVGAACITTVNPASITSGATPTLTVTVPATEVGSVIDFGTPATCASATVIAGTTLYTCMLPAITANTTMTVTLRRPSLTVMYAIASGKTAVTSGVSITATGALATDINSCTTNNSAACTDTSVIVNAANKVTLSATSTVLSKALTDASVTITWGGIACDGGSQSGTTCIFTMPTANTTVTFAAAESGGGQDFGANKAVSKDNVKNAVIVSNLGDSIPESIISDSLGQINCGLDCIGDNYKKDDIVTFTATVLQPGVTIEWFNNGEELPNCLPFTSLKNSLSSICTIDMKTVKLKSHLVLLEVKYTKKRYPVEVLPSTAGIITSDTFGVEDISCGDVCLASIEANKVVTFTASALDKNTKIIWKGNAVSCGTDIGTSMCTMTIDSAKTISVAYVKHSDEQVLDISRSGNMEAHGVVVSSNGTTINCASTSLSCTTSVKTGDLITLTASVPVTAVGTIITWLGENLPNSCKTAFTTTSTLLSSICTVKLDSSMSLDVNFDAPIVELEVKHANNSLPGQIVSTPFGIECSLVAGVCNAAFAKGSVIALVATPNDKNAIAIWEGCNTIESNKCIIEMVTNKKVTFNIYIPKRNLNVVTDGSGYITTNIGSIQCGVNCTELYNNNQLVDIYAQATRSGDQIVWGGDAALCASSVNNSVCSIVMGADKNIKVTFGSKLFITKKGNGTITSNDRLINCGTQCSALVETNKSIILTATATQPEQLITWSKNTNCAATITSVDNLNSSCTVMMDQYQNVSVVFGSANSNSTELDDNNFYVLLVKNALKAWNIGLENNFKGISQSTTSVSSPSADIPVDIIISLDSLSDQDTDVLGICSFEWSYDGLGGYFTKASLRLKDTWFLNPATTSDEKRTVIIHEMGHCLGLLHPNEVTEKDISPLSFIPNNPLVCTNNINASIKRLQDCLMYSASNQLLPSIEERTAIANIYKPLQEFSINAPFNSGISENIIKNRARFYTYKMFSSPNFGVRHRVLPNIYLSKDIYNLYVNGETIQKRERL